jgi:hypothetical protein
MVVRQYNTSYITNDSLSLQSAEKSGYFITRDQDQQREFKTHRKDIIIFFPCSCILVLRLCAHIPWPTSFFCLPSFIISLFDIMAHAHEDQTLRSSFEERSMQELA